MSELTITTPGNTGWIAYSGADPAAAKKFYSDVVGWTIAEIPMQDGSSHSAIMVGDGPIGGFMPNPAENASWMVFVTVEDVDACVAKVESAGGRVLSPPTDMPGVGRMSTIADPNGGAISLITYESMRKTS
ncbi:MAG: VOC family protein [Geminicoccaceae bacterium]